MLLKKNVKSLNNKVSKYNLEWQILRVNLKNLEFNIRRKLLYLFFNENKTEENCIRILNYLEGLKISSVFKEEIEKEIFYYTMELNKNLFKEDKIYLDFKKFSFEEKFKLFKDLFNRNKKWLLKGYYHKEQNNFLNLLLQDLLEKDLKMIKYKKILDELQKNCSFIENTYKFIY